MNSKLRHAAALALVGFWLVLLPPVGKGIVNTKAPLKQWRVTGHVFIRQRSVKHSQHAIKPRREENTFRIRIEKDLFGIEAAETSNGLP